MKLQELQYLTTLKCMLRYLLFNFFNLQFIFQTGIAHRRLKPLLGLIDPENTKTMPKEVAST